MGSAAWATPINSNVPTLNSNMSTFNRNMPTCNSHTVGAPYLRWTFKVVNPQPANLPNTRLIYLFLFMC